MSSEDLIAEARRDAPGDDATELAVMVHRLADALEAATSERDDATEELEAQLAIANAGWESALRIVNEGNEIIKQVGAERDAALAVIERVRAIHKVKHGEKARYAPGDEPGVAIPTHFEAYVICENCLTRWPCPTIQALDGAPEPEVEEEEYQAGCGSWDCRAPECGRA